VRLPVSSVTIRLRVTVDYVVKTNITNKSCLVRKRTKTHYTKRNTTN